MSDVHNISLGRIFLQILLAALTSAHRLVQSQYRPVFYAALGLEVFAGLGYPGTMLVYLPECLSVDTEQTLCSSVQHSTRNYNWISPSLTCDRIIWSQCPISQSSCSADTRYKECGT
ncbi:hypothetical protein B9Z19DRAFT_1076715 [Tuber borchii]|uniref:Uncharacterized protein n=1 Tax=Tuber borchii TaxID=42251 RepID=A0A2T7A1A2_TUBBO|nr:hypothetical protein B9Z19DRAFT_1076715 [Tuber borchii]